MSIAVALLAFALPLPDGLSEEGRRAAVIALLMAVWWASEALPLAATALVPAFAFPLAGIASPEATAASYGDPLLFLFLGGFLLAAALERCGLHVWLASMCVRLAGRDPHRLVLSLMAATAFLSLWVSNTATAMVMTPIAVSVAGGGGRTGGGEVTERDDLGVALLLGVAFSATIGGIGTLIGTPPNALFAAHVERAYGVSIGFAEWMLIGLPIVVVLLLLTWLLLTRVLLRMPGPLAADQRFRGAPGGLTRDQRWVAAVLALTASGWVLRPVLETLPGLSGLSDSALSIGAAITLFLLPSSRPGEKLLCWRDAAAIRWDVLILIGGGLALADAIGSTGLAGWIAGGAADFAGLPAGVAILVLMAVIVVTGELASNTAIAAIFLPVAGAMAAGLGLDPLALLLPVVLAASLGFMLPVATPPNAIVYGSGRVTARQMLRTGAILDVVSILIVYAAAMLLGPLLLPRLGGSGP